MNEHADLKSILSRIAWDTAGLVPGIVQDIATGQVRMLGYLSPESLEKTLDTGLVHFHSRSRETLWMKGETSGNVLRFVSLHVDCDGDALLIGVNAVGPTCHTGSVSCFDMLLAGAEPGPPPADLLRELEATVAQRYTERPENSYTSYLFDEGIDKIGKKIGEEAAEVIIAAKNGDPEPLANESADLLYHLLVLLRECDVDLDAVLAALEGRRR